MCLILRPSRRLTRVSNWTVTCQSELDEFEVMVACEEEQFVEKAGKDRLTVSFDIPANDGTEDRVYKIYVNDDYTGSERYADL